MYRWILAIVMMVCAGIAGAQSVRTYIPPQAFDHKATIAKELDQHFPQLHERNYVPALIEHSCISLKHSRCWKSHSQLRVLGSWVWVLDKSPKPITLTVRYVLTA